MENNRRASLNNLLDKLDPSGDSFVGDLDQTGRAKLADLIQANKLHQEISSDQPTEFEYSNKIVTDPKALFFSPESDQSNDVGDKISPAESLVDDLASSQTDKSPHQVHTNQQDSYGLGEDKLSVSGKKPATGGLGHDKRNEEPKHLTTLLEDDFDGSTTKSKTNEIDSSVKSTTNQVTTTDDIAYGTVVKSAAKQDGTNISTGSAPTSIFSRMYKNLASYLPFLNQLNVISGNKNNKIEGHKSVASSGNEDTDKFASAKQRVSTPKAAESIVENSIVSGVNDNVSSSSEANSEDNIRDNDKQIKGRETELPIGSKTELDSNISTGSASALDSTSKVELSSGNPTDVGTETDKPSRFTQAAYSDTDQESYYQGAEHGIETGQKREHKVHMMRQSGLVLPAEPSHDELIDAGQPAASLIGKYVFAPDHQYLTNSAGQMRNSKALDMDDELYAQLSHRSYSRHLQPNLYNSYANLGTLYGPQTAAGSNLVANKSNDVYFLVMVAAFCAMAMTVVLAAGLFAYRVQQSRKTSTETDYPTYGVVGPNNMNGKCGAASFVGGYFGSIGHGSSSSNSKSGSAKHLADIHSQSDSGVVTNGKSLGKRASNEQSSTGSSRLDFMANQNAARMYHYQHQKQSMIADRTSNGRHTSASDLDSEDENDDGSYTVYECPGLASAHEMEIKNPLFNDDRTP